MFAEVSGVAGSALSNIAGNIWSGNAGGVYSGILSPLISYHAYRTAGQSNSNLKVGEGDGKETKQLFIVYCLFIIGCVLYK